jgi:transposase
LPGPPRPARGLQRDPLRQPCRHPCHYLPHNLPPWSTVYGYFTAWATDGIFAGLNYQLTGLVRTQTGCTPTPTASVIDTQSIKTFTNVPRSSQGLDAGKKNVAAKSTNLAKHLTDESTPTWDHV